MDHPVCPDCSSAKCLLVGPLPDVVSFAGKPLDEVMSGGNLYSCVKCSLMFRAPLLEMDGYQELYDNDLAETWSLDDTREDQKLVSNYLHEHLGPGARLLDVGCYTGALLGSLNGAFMGFGLEINSSAAQLAKTNFGVVVWRTLDEIPAHLRFDAILAIDVIEHFASPRKFIESVLPMLSDKGFLIVTTGDGDSFWSKLIGSKWWYCAFAEHTAFISKRWLRYHVGPLGAKIVQVKRFRYKKLRYNLLRRISLAAYSIAPIPYTSIRRLINRMTGQRGAMVAPGFGVTADHLFIVLAQRNLVSGPRAADVAIATL